MKKFCISLFLIAIIVVVSLIGIKKPNNNEDYLRIHIRANSNAQADLSIKYSVKDLTVSLLTPIVKNSQTKKQLIDNVNENKNYLESEINNFLSENGFLYTATILIKEEEFPTRVYGDLTLNQGFYDAVIVNLGKATGDNWWCVVYPPLCFSGEEDGVTYKSKISEIFNSIKTALNS